MKRLSFLDTNIFVYSDDLSASKKRPQAIELISALQKSGAAVISLQVLQEYFAIATRKLGVPAEIAQRKVEIMSRMPMVRFQPDDVIRAIEFHRLHGVSFWDAMIVQAAQMAGAEILYSEDMQHDWRIGSLRVVNPFRA